MTEEYHIITRRLVRAQINVVKREGHYIEGNAREYCSWDENETPLGSSLHSEFCVKWDGCSHFYFKGEDEKDSYYHLCGFDSYKIHIVIIAAIYQIAHDSLENFDENEEFTDLLKEYEIVKVK